MYTVTLTEAWFLNGKYGQGTGIGMSKSVQTATRIARRALAKFPLSHGTPIISFKKIIDPYGKECFLPF